MARILSESDHETLIQIISAVSCLAAYLILVHLLGYRRNEIPLDVTSTWLGVPTLVGLIIAPLGLSGFSATALMALGIQAVIWVGVSLPAFCYGSHSSLRFLLARYVDRWLPVAGLISLALGISVIDPWAQGTLIMVGLIELQWALRRRRLAMRRSQDGCIPGSLPCALNDITNAQGRDMPQCCQSLLRSHLILTTQALSEVGLKHWLDGGTLLGAHRHGRFLPWEDDADLSIALPNPADEATARRAIRNIAAHHYLGYQSYPHVGLECLTADPPLLYGPERHRLPGEARLDIVFCRPSGERPNGFARHTKKGILTPGSDGRFEMPDQLAQPMTDLMFEGHRFPVPASHDAYLQALYGDINTVDLTYLTSKAKTARASA